MAGETYHFDFALALEERTDVSVQETVTRFSKWKSIAGGMIIFRVQMVVPLEHGEQFMISR